MSSLFEEYESQQQESVNTTSNSSVIATALFRSLKIEDDTPIFTKQKINFQPNHDIVGLVVSNNRIVLAMTNNVLVMINLLQPHLVEEIDISKHSANGKVHSLFLDPSGQHLIVSLCSSNRVDSVDTIYISCHTKKIRSIGKLKKHLITSVAWSQRNASQVLTGPLVCGTSKSLLFELELSSEEGVFHSGGFEPYCKQLMDIGKAEEITGVEILPCPINDHEYVILCATKSRLYTFNGSVVSTEARPLLVDVFSTYDKDDLKNYFEYKGTNTTSFLKLYYQPSTMMATSFAWTNGHGILTGNFNWNNMNNVTDDIKLIKVTRDSGSSKLLSQVGVGLVLTPFHLLIPHDSEVSVVSVLSEKVLINDRIPPDCGKAVGISQDNIKGTIWLIAEKGIFKCKMDREDRNVWKLYLEQNKYELAKKYCHGDRLKLSEVRITEAEELFQKGEYVQSANMFSNTLMPFEQIFFKLNSVDDDSGLRVFLLEKLNTLGEDEQGQYSLITLIMLEYYFNRLGQLRDERNEDSSAYLQINDELETFLHQPRIRHTLMMNSNSVYHLLSSHADKANIIKISLLIKDYDRVVTHLINNNQHMEALQILAQHASEDLMLQHIPILLKIIPVPTVDIMISKGHKLDPLKIVPILVHVHASKGCTKDIVHYLEHCVVEMEITDSVVHNFLITLYATEYSDRLLPYLKLQGDNIESVCYDTKLALRECLSAKQEVAAIHILTVMNLYKEAVELALKSNVDLAKATADRQRNDPQLRKKLWLLITEHQVKESQNVEKSLAIMNECELIKIGDVLPFFPNFATIDLFKDAICESLQEYNREIEELKDEMDDASKIADGMRAEIQQLKQQHTTVLPEDVCDECETPVLDRPFYLFQCSHKFHQDCLSEAVTDYLTVDEKSKMFQLRSKLQSMVADDGRISKALWEERLAVRAELDEILACECLYCGDRIIDSIDKPYIDDSDWHKVLDEWD